MSTKPADSVAVVATAKPLREYAAVLGEEAETRSAELSAATRLFVARVRMPAALIQAA